jgi:exoribonuclease R
MVRYQSLEGKWSVDTTNYTVTNEMGEKIRLGDPLKVVVKSVDLERKQIDFTIL